MGETIRKSGVDIAKIEATPQLSSEILKALKTTQPPELINDMMSRLNLYSFPEGSLPKEIEDINYLAFFGPTPQTPKVVYPPNKFKLHQITAELDTNNQFYQEADYFKAVSMIVTAPTRPIIFHLSFINRGKLGPSDLDVHFLDKGSRLVADNSLNYYTDQDNLRQFTYPHSSLRPDKSILCIADRNYLNHLLTKFRKGPSNFVWVTELKEAQNKPSRGHYG